jgi:hypothetical protein
VLTRSAQNLILIRDFCADTRTSMYHLDHVHNWVLCLLGMSKREQKQNLLGIC